MLNTSISALKISFRYFVSLRYLRTHFNFLQSSFSGLETLVVRNKIVVWISCLALFAANNSCVLTILLGRRSKEESSAFFLKNEKQAWTNFLSEKYELNFRQTNEVSTEGSGNVYHVGFYAISNVLENGWLIFPPSLSTATLPANSSFAGTAS